MQDFEYEANAMYDLVNRKASAQNPVFSFKTHLQYHRVEAKVKPSVISMI